MSPKLVPGKGESLPFTSVSVVIEEQKTDELRSECSLKKGTSESSSLGEKGRGSVKEMDPTFSVRKKTLTKIINKTQKLKKESNG